MTKKHKGYKQIIQNYTKPISNIIDSFLGSGTTAQVCEELGIPWHGYEISEDYIPDIKKRIKQGIKMHSNKKIKKLSNY